MINKNRSVLAVLLSIGLLTMGSTVTTAETISLTSDSTYYFTYTPPSTDGNVNVTITVDISQPNGVTFLARLENLELVNTSNVVGTNGDEDAPAITGQIMPGETLWLYFVATQCNGGRTINTQSIDFQRVGNLVVDVNVNSVETIFDGENDCSDQDYSIPEETGWDKFVALLPVMGLFTTFIVIMIIVTPKRSDLEYGN